MTEMTIPRAWTHGEDCPVGGLAVHELFLAHARRDPDALAVRQWDTRLTYRQLAATASALAERLSEAGLRRGAPVGICMRRTPWLTASMLGVLMAGGAFVPLDLDQPVQRLRTICLDAKIEIALVDGAGRQRLAGVVGTLVTAGESGSSEAVPAGARPVGWDDPAYIMYTSGSTGRPKGVVVSHRNLAAFAAAANRYLGDSPGYRQAGFAAVGFDVSVYEFVAPLVYGASLHLVSEAERADAGRLQRFLEEHRVTRAFLPPVLLPLLDPDRLPALRDVIVGGEPCDPRQVGRWAVRGSRRFHNWYGPTEATVAVLGIELDGRWDKPLPIGRPLPGCRVYVLDEDLSVCPPGRTGELYIGGPQVAQGYVGGASENARFVTGLGLDTDGDGGAGTLYRTGDLAMWDETGVVWFLGRADRQVKIHGKRVEPGEIEAVLSGHPRVTQAVVGISGSTVEAFVTPADAPSADELRAYCADVLPPHMVPARVIALDRIPRTVNAKVDFAALRRLGAAADPAPATSPERPDVLGQAVAEEWAVLFGVTRPGLGDDFFLAGGDSLSAMRLAATLRHRTGREVTGEDIFKGRTLGGIAALVAAAPPTEGTVLPVGSGPVLSPAQRRLWFVERFAPGVPVHNIVLAERLAGVVDTAALCRAMERVIRRQAALRWRLSPGGGLPDITLAEPEPVIPGAEDLSDLDEAARESRLAAVLEDEARTPIDLTGGPLWRIRLIRLGADDHALVFTVHHIVFDGWSQAVFYADLGEAYRAELSGALWDDSQPAVTFADYTTWTLEQASRRGQTDLTWWERHLSGAPTVLDLPRDRPRPAVASFGGSTCGTDLSPAVAARVTELAAVQGTTPGVVLLAAFSVLLRRLTGQDEQIVGAPVADRGHVGFEHLVGFFIRTLPIRLRTDDHADFGEHVRRCRDELASARRHADAPLERIVEVLARGRDLSRNPLYQVMFNVYNFEEAHLELGGVTARPLKAAVPGSLVDLTLYVIPHGDDVRIEAVYNRDLFDEPRIQAMLDGYASLLRELTGDPRRRVGAASVRPANWRELPGWRRLPDWRVPLSAEVAAAPGLLEQVRAIGRAMPDSVAVRDDERVLTYRDVLRILDATAARLRAEGAGVGDVVAVLAERTALLPAVLLGVLSAGARWAILDGELPSEALDRRLTVIGPVALITVGGAATVPASAEGLPVVDAAGLGHAGGAAGADVPVADRGYLSFTSGTTGEPRAVRTGEGPLVHFLNWYRARFGFGPAARFALLGGLGHDPLLRDMFTPLACGGSLAVPPAGLLHDPARLGSWLTEQDVTVAHLTPQLARMLSAGGGRPSSLESLRLVAVAGDQLTEGDVAALGAIAPRASVVNFYGTTETPQAQAYQEVTVPVSPGSGSTAARRTKPVAVGRGIDGAQLLVMSVCGLPAAVGELGEVIIRSRHLSDGYLDPRDDSRFAPLPGAGDGRVFRTGDLGRYDPYGAVTLAGRTDDQVKVRGFRVELGEVEAVLCSHPDVTQAAVRLLESDGASALHGYVVSTSPALAETNVLNHARSQLPPYAVPSGITVLRALPLTAAGKVDRRALPEPGSRAGAAADSGGAARGHVERLVLAIWSEVLGHSRAGRDDNFFEVGGHSMAIIEVQSRLKRDLGREIPVVDLFRFPTASLLASHLEGDGAGAELLDADIRGRLRRERASRPRMHNR